MWLFHERLLDIWKPKILACSIIFQSWPLTLLGWLNITSSFVHLVLISSNLLCKFVNRLLDFTVLQLCDCFRNSGITVIFPQVRARDVEVVHQNNKQLGTKFCPQWDPWWKRPPTSGNSQLPGESTYDLGPVQTHPFLFENEKFSSSLTYRPHVFGENGQCKLIFSETPFRLDIFENTGFSFTWMDENEDYRIQHFLLAFKHALYGWTGENNSNMLRMNVCFFSKRSKKSPFSKISGNVEPRYKEPLYNVVLDITNDFLYPSSSKICEKEPQCNETSLYSERILPLPWPLITGSRFHCINTLKFCPLYIFYCVSLTSVFWNFFFLKMLCYVRKIIKA